MDPARKVPPLRDRLWFLTVFFLLVLCGQCGIKGRPEPSRSPVPAAVHDLQAARVGNHLRLTWSSPEAGAVAFGGLQEFKVFRYRSPLMTGWGPDSPMPFRHLLTIKVRDPWPARQEDGHFIFADSVDPDFQYAYKVVTCHRSGGMSKDSNIVFWPAVEKW